MRRAVLVAACCLAVLAAGCGGDDSSTEAWADDFCGAIDDWRERVQGAAAELADPAALSEEQLDESIRRRWPPPTTCSPISASSGLPELEARDEIEQELDHLESVLRERAANARAGIDQPAGSVSEALARLAALSTRARRRCGDHRADDREAPRPRSGRRAEAGARSSDACAPLKG